MQLFRSLLCSLLLTSASLSVQAQTILKQNGKFGLSDADGTIIIQPECDLIEQAYFVILRGVRNGEDIPLKEPTDLPMYFLKLGNKYAYAYKMSFDSLTHLSADKVHWEISSFEFDSLVVRTIGTSSYADNFGYSTIFFKKNSRWGIIYVQTITGSGGGIFPSAGIYTLAMGRQNRTEPKYDRIFISDSDDIYPTLLNGKYGLIDPIRKEEYLPEFDTLPLFVSMRVRYVKKNGKWGVIRMNQSTRQIDYIAPCRYNRFEKFEPYIFVSSGIGDTVTFFDARLLTSYTPLVDGRPIVILPDSHEVSIHPLSIDDNPENYFLVGFSDKKKPPSREWDHFGKLFICNLNKRTCRAYLDSTFIYRAVYTTLGYKFVSKQLRTKNRKTRLVEFYSFTTNEFCFSFVLDTGFIYSSETLTDKYGKVISERFYYVDKNRNRVTIGIYDFARSEFMHKQRKFRPKKNHP